MCQMLLKRIELLLDPEVDAIGFVAMRKDGSTYLREVVKVNDGDRVQIYEGVTVSRRTLED